MIPDHTNQFPLRLKLRDNFCSMDSGSLLALPEVMILLGKKNGRGVECGSTDRLTRIGVQG